MQNKTLVFNHSKVYFLGLIIVLLLCALFLATYGKANTFLILNTYHSYSLDNFFVSYTFFGDGLFAIVLALLLFFYFKKKYISIAMFIAFILSGFVVQTTKNLIPMPRPRLFFEPTQYLNFLNGISLANNSSFFSGHTTTAFAIATVLALTIKNKWGQISVLFLAMLVGYSRIYLGQHFLLDVIVGAAIGTLCAIIAAYFVNKIKWIKE